MYDNESYSWTVGQRYTCYTKEECIRIAHKAKEDGFDVRYGVNSLGHYYFEIVDPFESGDC